MQTENFSQQNGLQLIESMINRAKSRFNENGTLYLLWGYTILLCCLVQFITNYFFHNDKAYYTWLLTWIVAAYQVYFLSKKRKKEKVKTYTDHIMAAVWICFAVSLFLVIFILNVNRAYTLINPVLLVLYGVPTVLSGTIIRFKPLVIGGIVCAVLSFVSVYTPVEFHVLLIAAAVIAAWIIPGHLLRIKFKKYAYE